MEFTLDLAELSSQYIFPWVINIVLTIVVFFVGRWLARLIVRLAKSLMKRSKLDEMLSEFLASLLGGLLLLVVIIAALDQLGVDTTSLIALIAAAGLAVGLALQNSLANFAAGVMLIIFKPFKVGDHVEAGGSAGVVERISIFNSLMRTGDNREIVIPNGQIYGGIIVNYSARDTRRIDLVFGIGYEDDIRKAKQLIQHVIDRDERILKEPAPSIAVGELADSSVNLNVRPWVRSEDYGGVRADLLENVKLAFDDNGISIPYPQTDIHLHQATV